MQQAGANGIKSMIRDDISLAQQLYKELSKHKNLQTFPGDLSITTFRYVPDEIPGDVLQKEEYLNQINTNLLNLLQRGGELFVSNTLLEGKYLLRSCIVNFRTSIEDIKAIPEIVIRYGKEAEKEMTIH